MHSYQVAIASELKTTTSVFIGSTDLRLSQPA